MGCAIDKVPGVVGDTPLLLFFSLYWELLRILKTMGNFDITKQKAYRSQKSDRP